MEIGINNDMISVKFSDHVFHFFDKFNKHIGGFTIRDLVQFISSVKLFNNLNNSECNAIIEQFVISKENKCHFREYTNSPFMGNIGLLIILNNEFSNYIENDFKTDLGLFNNEIQHRIKFIINRSLYELCNYMLKLFNVILNEIKDNPTKTKIVSKIQTCSIKLLHQMNSCFYVEIKMLHKKYHMLKHQNLGNAREKFVVVPENDETMHKTLEKIGDMGISEQEKNGTRKLDENKKEKNELCKKLNELPTLNPKNAHVHPEKIKLIQKISDELANRYIETSEYVS